MSLSRAVVCKRKQCVQEIVFYFPISSFFSPKTQQMDDFINFNFFLPGFCEYNSFFFFFNVKTCVKYCSQPERDAVYKELGPHLLTLACNTYAVHLVKKMLDNGMIQLKRIN